MAINSLINRWTQRHFHFHHAASLIHRLEKDTSHSHEILRRRRKAKDRKLAPSKKITNKKYEITPECTSRAAAYPCDPLISSLNGCSRQNGHAVTCTSTRALAWVLTELQHETNTDNPLPDLFIQIKCKFTQFFPLRECSMHQSLNFFIF